MKMKLWFGALCCLFTTIYFQDNCLAVLLAVFLNGKWHSEDDQGKRTEAG